MENIEDRNQYAVDSMDDIDNISFDELDDEDGDVAFEENEDDEDNLDDTDDTDGEFGDDFEDDELTEGTEEDSEDSENENGGSTEYSDDTPLNLDDGTYDDGADIGFDDDEQGTMGVADDDGTHVNQSDLMDDSGYLIEDPNSFISDTGDIVVMDNSEKGEYFKLKYVDIESVAIVRRVRSNKTVTDLVKSIRSTGLLTPIVVAPTATDGLYVLLDGYRRMLACAAVGIRNIPCIVNTKVSTPEIPILEAMYNHKKSYTISEMIDYIEYLEKQKGILSASMIEYLLQMNNGDYTKLKDLLNDDDEDIISKLMDGTYTIGEAFKKLEQRRKKESAEEKDLKKADKVYSDTEESGVGQLEGSGEAGNGDALTDEEINNIAIGAEQLDEGLDDMSLEDMVKDSKGMKGFEDHVQDPHAREIIDPAIRKAVMARDNNTCQCCKRGGPDYVDILDLHHIIEVHYGGNDSVENGLSICLNCHKQVHLFAFNKLFIPPIKSESTIQEMSADEQTLYKEEQNKYKRIVKLGNVIRECMQKSGEKLDDAKKKHPIDKIGRQMPGTKNTIA